MHLRSLKQNYGVQAARERIYILSFSHAFLTPRTEILYGLKKSHWARHD
jgi:hypothetical protein